MRPVSAKFLFGMLQMVNRTVNGPLIAICCRATVLLSPENSSTGQPSFGVHFAALRPARPPGRRNEQLGAPCPFLFGQREAWAVDGSGYVVHNLPTARRTR